MNATDGFPFEELDAYLTALQGGKKAVPGGDLFQGHARLLDGLIQLADNLRPDPAFSQALALRLQHASANEDPAPAWAKTLRQFLKGQAGRSPAMFRYAAFAVLCSLSLVVLGAACLFLINQIRPIFTARVMQADSTAAPLPGAVISNVPTGTIPLYTPFPTPAQPPILPSIAQALGLGYGGGGGGQTSGGLSFILGTELPASPSELTAHFRQTTPPMTLESARMIATQWNLNAQLYLTPGVASDSIADKYFFAFDGMQQLIVDSNTLNYENRSIFPVYGGHQYPQTGLPPVDQTMATAIEFLDSRGQLGFSYVTGFSRYAYGIVDFYRLLDGWRLKDPVAWVQVDPQGQVGAATTHALELQAIGTYPVLSAQEAWQILTTNPADQRTWTSITPSQDGNPQYWGRSYPAGQAAHLFGALEYLLLPVDAGGSPRVSLNNLVLEGDLTGLIQYAQTNPGYFHVWGVVQEAFGTRSLQIAGWEPFDEFNGTFDGYVSRQAEGDYLVLADGRLLRLPDLPADAPDGEPLYANGGLVGDTLEWFVLQVHPANESLNPPGLISGEAFIDRVELIFLNPLESLPPELDQDPAYKMLQPVWCFSGTIAPDYSITIYVQAARE